MTNYSSSFAGRLVLLLLAITGLPAAWADDLDRVQFGESARSFAAGSIQLSTPQDGVVNVITGDNQTSGNRMRLGQNDVFYLKLKNPGEAAVGDLFTVFKRTRKVYHPVTGDYLGYLVNRLAVVEIVQVDKVLTTVRALRAYGAVSPGDPVVKFSLPVQGEPTSSSDASDVMGMVIELQSDMGMTLVAQRNIVYLDRGSEDGLKNGDSMEVVRFGGGLPPRTVGEVRVLSTEAKTATALITKSTSRVLKGDRFRSPLHAGDVVPTRVSQPVSQSVEAPLVSSDRAPEKTEPQQVAGETRFTLNDLTNQLRYDSGEATIKPEGYHVLDQLIVKLKAASPDQLIRVEGHADDMEIGPSLQSVYPTNWDLSKARATGVLRYIVQKGGIDSARISSVGYGDSKPVVSNATETGREKNRRVDIVLYSPESVDAPASQAVKQVEPTRDGYQVSGIGSDDRTASMPADDRGAPVEPAATQDPASVPSGQAADATPVIDGQSVSPQTDQPIAPPQP
ncbi:MAG TPA: OmpA family protein [Nitrospira sp.]